MIENELRSLLGHNSAMTQRARAHGEKVKAAAVEELARINARLGEMKAADTLLDPKAAHEYRRLVLLRAKLSMLVSG